MKKQFLTSTQIYTKFKSDINSIDIGKINFTMKNISIDLTIKDIIGNVLQAWFGEWLNKNNIYYATKKNTQEFPDFILNTNIKNSILEFKSFDSTKSPNFDVANFDSYCRSLLTNSFRLDADYLIVSYKLNGVNINIEEIWLKKVWQICTNSKKFPLRTQFKQGTIHNIRPATWYSKRSTFKPFNSKEDFVQAIYETLKVYKKPNTNADIWLEKVYKNYQEHTKKQLNVTLDTSYFFNQNRYPLTTHFCIVEGLMSE